MVKGHDVVGERLLRGGRMSSHAATVGGMMIFLEAGPLRTGSRVRTGPTPVDEHSRLFKEELFFLQLLTHAE